MTDTNGETESRRLNWRQACEILGCRRSYFYRLVNSGKLRAFRVGPSRRNLWVYKDDCRALLNRIGN